MFLRILLLTAFLSSCSSYQNRVNIEKEENMIISLEEKTMREIRKNDRRKRGSYVILPDMGENNSAKFFLEDPY